MPFISMSSNGNGAASSAAAEQGSLHCSISTIAHIESAKYAAMMLLHRNMVQRRSQMFVIAVVFLLSALTLSILGAIEA